MTLPRTVSDVGAEHTCSRWSASTGRISTSTSRSCSIRPGIVGYVHRQLGLRIASTAPLGKITDAFNAPETDPCPPPRGLARLLAIAGQPRAVRQRVLTAFPAPENLLGQAWGGTVWACPAGWRSAGGGALPGLACPA